MGPTSSACSRCCTTCSRTRSSSPRRRREAADREAADGPCPSTHVDDRGAGIRVQCPTPGSASRRTSSSSSSRPSSRQTARRAWALRRHGARPVDHPRDRPAARRRDPGRLAPGRAARSRSSSGVRCEPGRGSRRGPAVRRSPRPGCDLGVNPDRHRCCSRSKLTRRGDCMTGARSCSDQDDADFARRFATLRARRLQGTRGTGGTGPNASAHDYIGGPTRSSST